MIRLIECVGLLIFHLSGLYFAIQLVANHDAVSLIFALTALPLAYFASDLLTGFIHWACDSLGDSKTPIWGPMLVKPFRDHHNDPAKISQISLAENLGASAIAASIALFASLPILHGDFGLFLAWSWLWLLIFSTYSNLFHRWSHMKASKRPAWMKQLQRFGLILDPKVHLIHHRLPHRENYCILNGWANCLTNRIPWQRLESLLIRLKVKINFD